MWNRRLLLAGVAPVYCNVPPPNTKFELRLPPKLPVPMLLAVPESAIATAASVPPEIVVGPEYVLLAADKVSVPVPTLVRPPPSLDAAAIEPMFVVVPVTLFPPP